MKKFISCDWGTSSFRIRLIDSDHLQVISEITTNDGIAGIYNDWVATGRPSEERLMYYMNYLQRQLVELKKQSGTLLQDMPVIISGMASSTIGMIELPYKKLPFNVDGSDLNVQRFSDGKLIIVSGACTENDVLRGEETMLIGCGVSLSSEKHLMIFPGTHSKHLFVENGVARDFNTYMTGELFDLLSNRSILSNSVKKPDEGKDDHLSFDRGVMEGISGNILHEIFIVRTNQVIKKLNPSSNYAYLSGLLIGSELKSVAEQPVDKIILVCGMKLKRQYLRALQFVGGGKIIEFRDADQALIKGHQLISHLFPS